MISQGGLSNVCLFEDLRQGNHRYGTATTC